MDSALRGMVVGVPLSLVIWSLIGASLALI